ncbi:MAG: VCBS repeat-containing protein [Planctomycetes bacterium]|nr:VCBS repeat-containing protein [Planctomycetota bacterium]
MLPRGLDSPWAIALGDVDGDGNLDGLIGNALGGPTVNQNRLLLNEGSGVFRDATAQLPAGVLNTKAIAQGDVDGDGDLDAWIGTWGGFCGSCGAQDRLYLNDGSGVFSDATAQLPSVSDNTTAAALGDVDADGDLDALVGNDDGQLNRLHVNDGSGAFSDATAQLPAFPDATYAVALGDVDADGDLDALIGNSGLSRLLLNDGSGGFADAPGQIPMFLDNTSDVALGDADGDGDLDALLGGVPNRLYLNAGSGTFADAPSALPPLTAGTLAVDLGDVDGDGDLDVWVGTFAQDRLFVNDGTGVFSDATSQLPAMLGWTLTVAFGDVDADGDLDVLIAKAGEKRLQLNDGSGVFLDATSRLPSSRDRTAGLGLGDIDGDGDLDALTGNGGTSGPGDLVRLYLNDATGLFNDATIQLPAIPSSTAGVALADVDADGDLDALIGSVGQDRLYLNTGSGVFNDATIQLPAMPGSTTAVAAADVDSDGDLDAWLADIAQNRLYLNNGAGTYSNAPGQVPVILDQTLAVALGDVDGDGDLDALTGTTGSLGGQNRLFLNNGSGVFSNGTSQLPTMLDLTRAVSLGDLDADGDLDALIGNSALGAVPGGQDRLLLNNGSGVFTNAPGQLPLVFDYTQAIAIGDMDDDGDLDAVFGNSLGQQNRLYLNAGSGVLSDATAQLPALADDTYSLALGDLDGDGDLDVWVGNDGEDRLLSNLGRQLAWRGIPRVGKPLLLDLYGPASGGWLLAASLGSSSLDLPPFGTLRIDPLGLLFLGAGSFDPQGRASVILPIPQNAALVGLTLYWQAVVGGPFSFTNLEGTTFTNF